MKKLILLSLSIFTTTVMAVLPVTPAQEFPDDWNPYQQSEGVVCSQIDEVATLEKPCCSGLDKGDGGICVEAAIVDPGLTSCLNNSECSGGTACMPLSSKQLFSKVSPSWNKPEFAEEEMAINIQLSDVEEIKKVGESCSHAKDCSSYNCMIGRCVEKKVCRFADLGESPAIGQKCGEGYVLTNGVCDRKPNEKYPVYNNLLDEIKFTTGAGSCSEFRIDAVAEEESKKALKYIRALEWLFMTHTVHPENDCFDLTSAIKDDIFRTFYIERKIATEVLAKSIKEIEEDIWTLANAKNLGEEVVTIHGTESMTAKELDLRIASGNDALKIMIRRNSAFILYEEVMGRILKETSSKLEKMSSKLTSWTDDQGGSWDLGTRTTGAKACSARYRVWKPIRWRTKMYGNTANRWGVAYTFGTLESVGFPYTPQKIQASLASAHKVMLKETIAQPLAEILDIESVEELKKAYSRPFYLLDPVMHGGVNFAQYGANYSSGHRGFLGLGKRDIHPIRTSPDLAQIHSARKPQLLEYYKKFRDISETNAGIFYEPELSPMEAKDCLSKDVKAPTPELEEKRQAACKKFDSYLDEILDISMAQFLAYSLNGSKNYSNYFNNDSGRIRLLNDSQTKMVILGNYYSTAIEMQKQQNICLENVMRGLKEDGIVTDGKGGVEEGNYYDPGLIPGDIGSGSPAPTKLKPGAGGGRLAISNNIGSGLSKNFLNGSNGKIAGGSSSSNGSNGFGKGQSDSQFGSFFASKSKELQNKNSIAKSKGAKTSNPKKEYAETVASIDKGASGGAAGGASGQGGAGGNAGNGANGAFGNNGGSGSGNTDSSKGETDEMTGSNEMGNGNEKGTDQTAATGLASGALMGSGSGSSSSYGDSGQSASGVSQLTDQTGMSEEEKSQMMAVYDRNKSKYESDGEDGIFEKVSKAYVRNLEKILVRKKTID